ncbi:MAG TPA: PAS domain S-box protein [Desulfuromonadales bacterium]
MPASLNSAAFSPARTASRIAAIYLALALLWIYASDRVLVALSSDPARLTAWQTGKGWLFVIGSAALIFFLVRRALVAFHEAQTALRESERYNRTLFDQSSLGLALCRLDGRLVDVNPAFARMVGRSIEQTLDLTYWDITPECYAAQEQLQLDSLERTGCYGPCEKEYRHSDGHLVPVRLQGRLIERREERFIWSTVEDISDYKRAEIQNVEQLEELRRWHQATLGREMRIFQLKAEVNELAVRVGEPPRYLGGMSDEAAPPLSEKELTAPVRASCADAVPAGGEKPP